MPILAVSSVPFIESGSGNHLNHTCFKEKQFQDWMKSSSRCENIIKLLPHGFKSYTLGLSGIRSSEFVSSLAILNRCYHINSETSCIKVYRNLSVPPSYLPKSVAVFWDLDNKPPKSCPLCQAAVKLKTAVSSFGVIRHMVAYADRHAFTYVPQYVKDQRKVKKPLNQLESRGMNKPSEPFLCRVCGRRFYTNEKLVNHFKEIHEREHKKRLNQIESARGKMRVKLVAKYSMKMEKYRNAVREVLTPKIGYCLAGELKRAGFLVQSVPDRPQAAEIARKDHMIALMDKKQIGCMVIVSNDSDFVDVLEEAKLRRLKTVVVGDISDGALKRIADVGFTWSEILMGKAKKEATSVLERWKDRDILRRLEWRYDPEEERKKCGLEDADTEVTEDEDFVEYRW